MQTITQTVLYYFLESLICSAIFAAYYHCFLRNGNFYRHNRFYLLSAAAASLLIPIIHITFYVEIPVPPVLETFVETAFESLDSEMFLPPVQELATPVDYTKFLPALYFALVAGMLLIELRNLFKISRLKRGLQSTEIDGIKIYSVDSEAAPFSFFNTIFWRTNIDINSSDGKRIFMHELTHVKAGHSYDKLFMQMLCTIFWLNPVLRVFKRELNVVHECAADSACIADNNTAELSALILCSLYPDNYSEFTSRFFQSHIKRRLIMLCKNKNLKFALLRKLMIIPTVMIMLYVFAVDIEAKYIPEPAPAPEPTPLIDSAKTLTPPEPPQISDRQVGITKQFVNVRVWPYDHTYDSATKKNDKIVPRPKFQGKEDIAFGEWLAERLVEEGYPAEAKQKKIEGLVTVFFAVQTDGSIDGLKTLNRGRPVLANVVKKIIQQSPKWEPANINGKPTIMHYQIPVFFSLPKDSAKSNTVSFANVEEKPTFQGKDPKLFRDWIENRIMEVGYPAEAKEKNIQGTVLLSFTINEDGTLSDIKSIRKVDPLLSDLVIKIVKESPKWESGKHKGKAVKVPYQVPVVFRLDSAASTTSGLLPPPLPEMEAQTGITKQFVTVKICALSHYDQSTKQWKTSSRPAFQGKDDCFFAEWLAEHLVKEGYPVEAVRKKLEGEVSVLFSIGGDGSIFNIKTFKGKPVLAELSETVKKTLKESPKWGPVSVDGKPDMITYKTVVTYSLPKDSETSQNLVLNENSNKEPLYFEASDTCYSPGKERVAIFSDNFKIFNASNDTLMIKDRWNSKFSIDPSKIKSLTVLKDEAAVKIYGEKARKGVIIITFKDNDDNFGVANEKALASHNPLIIIDNMESSFKAFENLKQEQIESFSILKGDSAIKKYGEKGKNGVILVVTIKVKKFAGCPDTV